MLGLGRRALGALALTGVGLCATHRERTQAEGPVNLTEVISPGQKDEFDQAVKYTSCLLERTLVQTGAPGIVLAVSVDGQLVHSQGAGLADVENNVPCHPGTVMRIASISKAITMAAVARAWEKGLLDLDCPVQTYVPQFPTKTVDGKEVVVTTRQLVSHLAGIRHYDKDYMEKSAKKEKTEGDTDCDKKTDDPERDRKDEFAMKEYYIKKYYNSVNESLTLFQDDPLVHKPGSKFLYTTHGWTLVSAVLEGVYKKPFPDILQRLLRELGMTHTCLDKHRVITPHRARYYQRHKSGVLVNAPYVDLSYKWAGGGLHSTVGDLLVFGNAMLYSAQSSQSTAQPQTCCQEFVGASVYPPLPSPLLLQVRWNVLDPSLKINGLPCLSGAKHPHLLSRVDDRNSGHFDVCEKLIGGSLLQFLSLKDSDLKSFGSVNEQKGCGMMSGGFLVAGDGPSPSPQAEGRSTEKRSLPVLNSVESARDEAMTALIHTSLRNGIITKPPPGYLSPGTVEEMWKPVTPTKEEDPVSWYGLGWHVFPEHVSYGGAPTRRRHVWHSGGAVGASSILLILPREEGDTPDSLDPPRGVVVAMMVNLTGVSLKRQALELAMLFDRLPPEAFGHRSTPAETLASC